MSYKFKLEIHDTPVPVWREVTVPEYFSLHELHLVIQGAFGWENRHLYEFRYQNGTISTSYGDVVFNEMDGQLDSRKALLKKFFKKKGDALRYIYDFGDYWQHTVELQAKDKEDRFRPFCSNGEGNCPPEDVGGPPGYLELVRAFKGPVRPEKLSSLREWLGMKGNQVWNPTDFNLRSVNKRLCLIE